MTLLADGVMSDMHKKRKGYQLVIGADYGVGDFTNDLANGTITLKGERIALLVGNNAVEPGKNVNIAKQIEKLIRQIWVNKPVSTVYVSSVFPKPTQETVTQPIVMKVNGGIGRMCKKLDKFSGHSVKYVPLHQFVLEKWKHPDKSGKMLITTRIVQPHGRYFRIGTDILNETGLARILENLETLVQEGERSLMEREGLIVQFNPRDQTDIQVELREDSPDELASQVSTPVKGKHASKNLDEKVVKKRKIEQKEENTQTGSVTRLINQWEQLSQGQRDLDSIDLELGGESLVQVSLGDEDGSDAGTLESKGCSE